MSEQQQPVKKKTVLTGVKPTGEPHIGNYLGAIRPSLRLASTPDYESFLFIADYHALTTLPPAKEMKEDSHQVTATWLACGLDPEKSVI
ncbi:MAG: tryptophan--tRNA ligase, partial [Pseudobdellovibrionaceae bacterium]